MSLDSIAGPAHFYQMRAELWDQRTALAKLIILIFAGLAVLFGAVILVSYRWEYQHDTPLLQYGGLLMTKFGLVPYRDFFETSMPGVFIFHAALVRFLGVGNLTFILVAQAFLAALLIPSWLTLSKIDSRAATAFVIWFGLFYLAGGPAFVLQRDGLGLLPIAVALCLVAREVPRTRSLRWALIGMLLGLAALVKPHLSLGGGLVLLIDSYLVNRQPGQPIVKSLVLIALCAGLGFAVPTGLTLLWLSANDALGPFSEMVREYLPLHIQQDTSHVFREPTERAKHIIAGGLMLGGNWPYIPSLAVGIGFALSGYLEDRKRRLAIGIGILTLYYAVYPALTGQFWGYHFTPFFFFLLMTLSLLVGPVIDSKRISAVTIVCFMAVTLAVLGTLVKDFRLPVFRAQRPMDGLVARMEDALRAEWRPGQTIQPIDWTGGTIHAMLRLGAQIGTPFFYDYHFHHHVSNPYIQGLRSRFIAALNKNRPDFVIASKNHPRVSGVDTDTRFPELDAILQKTYCVVTTDPGFTLYKRCH